MPPTRFKASDRCRGAGRVEGFREAKVNQMKKPSIRIKQMWASSKKGAPLRAFARQCIEQGIREQAEVASQWLRNKGLASR